MDQLESKKVIWKFEMIIRSFENLVKELNSEMEMVEDPVRDMIFKIEGISQKAR